jgi:membrane dipeptidase
LQVCALFAELEESPERALAVAASQVAALERAARESPDAVSLVRSRAELTGPDGRLGLVLSLEGCKPLAAAPDLADVFFALGVRMVGLTWNGPNAFAHGAAEDPSLGLTPDGQELVERLAALGVVLDLAHASCATFDDVLGRGPDAALVVSHAGCRELVETPRNIDDNRLRRLAERGGVFCLMAHPFVIDPAGRSLERLVDHVDHAVGVMGLEHVGLGGDFTRQINLAVGPLEVDPSLSLSRGAPSGEVIEGLEGPGDYERLVAALRRRGYDGERLDAVLRGNLVRLLSDALPAA